MNDLNSLENNLIKAIELIHSLAQKNNALTDQTKDLIGKIEHKDKIIRELREQNQIDDISSNHLNSSKISENKIRIKVQQILEKLEKLESYEKPSTYQ